MERKRLTKQQVCALEWYVLYQAQLRGNKGIEHVLTLVESKSYYKAREIVRIVSDLKIAKGGLYYLLSSQNRDPKKPASFILWYLTKAPNHRRAISILSIKAQFGFFLFKQ